MGRLDITPEPDPKNYARDTLRKYGIDDYPIDPIEIFERMGNVTYREGELDPGKEGLSYKERDKCLIMVEKCITSQLRKKFTYAHELGHIEMEHVKDMRKIVCDADSIENFKHKDKNELYANEYASELILPTPLLKPYVKKNNITLDLVDEVSREFDASFTATAFKIVKISDWPCILVMSKNGEIQWRVFSYDLEYKYKIPRTILSEETYAHDLFENPLLNRLEGEIEGIEWLDDGDEPVEELGMIEEQSTYFPNYNQVLTLLIFPDLPYGEMSL